MKNKENAASEVIANCKAMNSLITDIWDNNILIRLKNGQINSEMDINAAFQVEIENHIKDKKLQNTWRCYQDIPLIPKNKDRTYRNSEYDLALFYYPEGISTPEETRKHYPAIVIEFKLWKDWGKIHDDILKLDALFEQGISGNDQPGYRFKTYAVHSMNIINSFSKSMFNKLGSYLRHEKVLRGKHSFSLPNEWEVKSDSELPAADIVIKETDCCQWNRYPKGQLYGREAWYPVKEDGSSKNNERKLIMLHLSRSIY